MKEKSKAGANRGGNKQANEQNKEEELPTDKKKRI